MAFGVHDLPLSSGFAHPCFCLMTFVPLTLLSMQGVIQPPPPHQAPGTPGISAAPQLQHHPHPRHLALCLWPMRDACQHRPLGDVYLEAPVKAQAGYFERTFTQLLSPGVFTSLPVIPVGCTHPRSTSESRASLRLSVTPRGCLTLIGHIR